MLFGVEPFSDPKDEREAMRGIRTKEISFPLTIQTSAQVKHLISQALSKVPEDRPTIDGLRNHAWFKKNKIPTSLPAKYMTEVPGADFDHKFLLVSQETKEKLSYDYHQQKIKANEGKKSSLTNV
jgi:serine/threonine protein kinase